uniref:Uncharacterized protein LOC111130713 n=1 Tax=Crassostrea virginica TaxID=6565 RepID=A0A8B8E075_CRAVI|nr:uncharacterized protein LOC111130713 [Crassostrea virginica]
MGPDSSLLCLGISHLSRGVQRVSGGHSQHPGRGLARPQRLPDMERGYFFHHRTCWNSLCQKENVICDYELHCYIRRFYGDHICQFSTPSGGSSKPRDGRQYLSERDQGPYDYHCHGNGGGGVSDLYLIHLLSCRVAKIAKEEMCQQREGMFHIKENGSPFTFTNILDNFSSLEESGIDLSSEGPELTESNDPSESQSGRGLRYQSSPRTNAAPSQEDRSGSSPVSIPVVRINTPLENTKSTCDTYSGVDGSNIYLEMKQ